VIPCPFDSSRNTARRLRSSGVRRCSKNSAREHASWVFAAEQESIAWPSAPALSGGRRCAPRPQGGERDRTRLAMRLCPNLHAYNRNTLIDHSCRNRPRPDDEAGRGRVLRQVSRGDRHRQCRRPAAMPRCSTAGFQRPHKPVSRSSLNTMAALAFGRAENVPAQRYSLMGQA